MPLSLSHLSSGHASGEGGEGHLASSLPYANQLSNFICHHHATNLLLEGQNVVQLQHENVSCMRICSREHQINNYSCFVDCGPVVSPAASQQGGPRFDSRQINQVTF